MATEPSKTNARTILFDDHVKFGARIVPFAGFEMPVQYTGVIQEAQAVRSGAGMFDVSHMARLRLKGEGVLSFLERVTTNDVSVLVDGKGQYSLLPNKTGGLVDDIIVYRVTEGHFFLVVNASNHAKDVSWLNENNAEGVAISDETGDTAMIAVQGPTAAEILANHADNSEGIRNAPAFGLVETNIFGIPVLAARSGYTGEDGFEVICANAHASALWSALAEAGVVPCGLGSRDTLRVEAGLPLYGHELNDELSPIAAGLGWVIGKTKSFNGSEIINEHRANGTSHKLQGIKLPMKRLLLPDAKVFLGDREIGYVTSGVVSPVLECGIGFAYIAADIALGTEVEVDMRGKRESATVVSKRFYKRAK